MFLHCGVRAVTHSERSLLKVAAKLFSESLVQAGSE